MGQTLIDIAPPELSYDSFGGEPSASRQSRGPLLIGRGLIVDVVRSTLDLALSLFGRPAPMPCVGIGGPSGWSINSNDICFR